VDISSISSLDWDTPSALLVVLIEVGLLRIYLMEAVGDARERKGYMGVDKFPDAVGDFLARNHVAGDFVSFFKHYSMSVKWNAFDKEFTDTGALGFPLLMAAAALAAFLSEKLMTFLKSVGERFWIAVNSSSCSISSPSSSSGTITSSPEIDTLLLETSPSWSSIALLSSLSLLRAAIAMFCSRMSSIAVEPEELSEGLFCLISVRKLEVSFPGAPIEDIDFERVTE